MSEVDLARRQTIGDIVRRSALRHGDKTALVFGDERRCYSGLDAIVSRTANAFTQRGVSQGDRIALHAHNSSGFVYAFLALARLSAVTVPINYMLNAGVLDEDGAAVVVRDRESVDADAILAHCREHLTGYKRPKHVVFVDELPKNASGKIVQRDLGERFADLAASA